MGNQKLRNYILTHMVQFIVLIDPIKYPLQQLVMSDKLARYMIVLLECDLKYIPQKSIKGRAMSDFLVDLQTKD